MSEFDCDSCVRKAPELKDEHVFKKKVQKMIINIENIMDEIGYSYYEDYSKLYITTNKLKYILDHINGFIISMQPYASSYKSGDYFPLPYNDFNEISETTKPLLLKIYNYWKTKKNYYSFIRNLKQKHSIFSDEEIADKIGYFL
jgi:hypothetical protein